MDLFRGLASDITIIAAITILCGVSVGLIAGFGSVNWLGIVIGAMIGRAIGIGLAAWIFR